MEFVRVDAYDGTLQGSTFMHTGRKTLIRLTVFFMHLADPSEILTFQPSVVVTLVPHCESCECSVSEILCPHLDQGWGWMGC